MLGLIKYLMMLSGYQVNKKKTPKRTMSLNFYMQAPSEKPTIIAVIGGRQENDENLRLAECVGRGIAKKGAILLCGGLSGVMESAAKGAKDCHGRTVGILPGKSKNDANPYIEIPLATGLGLSRNAIIASAADGVVAIGGGYGTLSEIAFALQFYKPVVGLATWDIEGVIKAHEPEEAIELVFQAIACKSR
jgi:hypothetical protein